ncbi:MAG: hypothetical protein ACRER2_01325 [Methylococcales bacterium]
MVVSEFLKRTSREEPKALPTMYDLPSEDPEEPALPDEFHSYQPQLLRESFVASQQANDRIYIGYDINVYYDSVQCDSDRMFPPCVVAKSLLNR